MSGRIVLVTGTDTGVGKTIVTAALAANAAAAGRRCLVVKPVQTGTADGEPGDADVVARLAGVETATLHSLPEPLAPDTAAARAGVVLPTIEVIAEQLIALTDSYDVVIAEGAGGVLVGLDSDHQTLADLAMELEFRHDVEVVVVCRAGLGTLNHTALTLEALVNRNIESPFVVIGSWPEEPGLAEQCNLADLQRIVGGALHGVVPENAGALSPDEFRRQALEWFSPS